MAAKKVRVAINGFGRIGRLAFKIMLEQDNLDVVAINDLSDPKTLAHLLKYDSVHGIFPGEIKAEEKAITVNGKTIAVFAERDPAALPWAAHNIEVVLESTGIFRDETGAGKHLNAGAKRVVISAPAKGDIPTVVLGVNEEILNEEHPILSNASCTTNCLAPMVKVLDDSFGVEQGFLTTIHAFTADQRLQDAPHSDLRRARAATVSIVPTSTGAAKAVGKVMPHLSGKLDGCAMRVPTPDGSLTDFSVMLKHEVTAEQINDTMKKAAEGKLKGILAYTDEPLVSIDIVGNPASCILDSGMTFAQGKMAKIVGWYDNEAGYSNRLVDLIQRITA